MRTFLTVMLLTAVVGLGACTNTYHGAGKDIENVGEEMQQQYN